MPEDLTAESVKKALEDVRDPSAAGGKTLVESGLLRVLVDGAHARITVETGGNDETRAGLEKEVRERIGRMLPSVQKLDVVFSKGLGSRDITSEDPLLGVRNLVMVLAGKGASASRPSPPTSPWRSPVRGCAWGCSMPTSMARACPPCSVSRGAQWRWAARSNRSSASG